MNRIIFNGQTGGLGRYFSPAFANFGLPTTTLIARLEHPQDALIELENLPTRKGDQVTLIPLAAMVPVGLCEKEPERAHKTNVTCTLALVSGFLDWADQRQLDARVLYVSTGHVYAPQGTGEQLRETDAVKPRSVYARTKLEAENQIKAIFQKRWMANLKIARLFGLLAVNQPPTYVLPALIKRVIHRDFKNVPGLACVRDYLDARDVCQRLALLCTMDWNKEPLRSWTILNICSGEGLLIKDLLVLVLKAAHLKLDDVHSELTEAPARPDDIPWMVGDPSRLSKIVEGSARLTPLEQTVHEAFSCAQPKNSPFARTNEL